MNDKELESRITNVLREVSEFTKLLDHKELSDMAKKLGKLKKIINTYNYIKRKLKGTLNEGS